VARALYTENREYVDMVKSNLGQQTDGRRPDVSVGFLNASARQFDPLASIGLAPSALHQKHILQVGSLFGLVLLALIRRCRPYIFTAGRQISDTRICAGNVMYTHRLAVRYTLRQASCGFPTLCSGKHLRTNIDR